MNLRAHKHEMTCEPLFSVLSIDIYIYVVREIILLHQSSKLHKIRYMSDKLRGEVVTYYHM